MEVKFDRISIKWFNGLTDPSSEFLYAVGRRHHTHVSNVDAVANDLKKKLKPSEGFIPDECFFGRATINRFDEPDLFDDRNKNEIENAFSYVMNMGVKLEMEELVHANDISFLKFVYFYQSIFMELLCRNRNVDLVLSKQMTKIVISKLSKLFDIPQAEVKRKIFVYSRQCKFGGPRMFDIISNVKIEGDTIEIVFHPKQNIHSTVFYPIM